MEIQSEPMGTGTFVVISAGNSGFKVACGKEVHYVAQFDQLVGLLDSLIVNKGRGKSARYEIRSHLSSKVVDEGEAGVSALLEVSHGASNL